MTAPSVPLPRYAYYEGPKPIGEIWTLRRDTLTMSCTLATHRLGWELRLTAGRNVVRTQLCTFEADVFTTSQAWRDEAQRQGWSATAE